MSDSLSELEEEDEEEDDDVFLWRDFCFDKTLETPLDAGLSGVFSSGDAFSILIDLLSVEGEPSIGVTRKSEKQWGRLSKLKLMEQFTY